MIGISPGRFDPATNGHLDIIRRAHRLCTDLIIAVYDLPEDRCLFSTERRVSLLEAAVDDLDSVRVQPFEGLLSEFARSVGASVIFRGLRAVTDFSDEFDQALMYKEMAPDLEQVYLMSDIRHIPLRASRIREIASLGYDVSDLVPAGVFAALQERWTMPYGPPPGG